MTAPRDDRLFLADIRNAISRIQSYVIGVDEETFLAEPLVQDAVVRQLEIIGEASKRLSPAFRESRPDIPWADMIGMRSKLAHDYLTVDLQVVWDTVQRDLPDLLLRLTQAPDPSTGSNGA